MSGPSPSYPDMDLVRPPPMLPCEPDVAFLRAPPIIRAVFWLHLPTVSRVSLLKTVLARPPSFWLAGNDVAPGGLEEPGCGRGGGWKPYGAADGVTDGINGVVGIAEGGPAEGYELPGDGALVPGAWCGCCGKLAEGLDGNAAGE